MNFNSLIRSNLPVNLACCDYEKITVTDASIKMLTVPSGTKYCEIFVESATTSGYVANYVTYEDTTTTLPTATDGIPVMNGTFFDIPNVDSISNFRIIGRTGITTTLHVQYYK